MAAPAPATGKKLQIDVAVFSKRIKSLFATWQDQTSTLWNDADAMAFATPPSSEDLRYLKSSAIQMWLFSYEFPETVLVFVRGKRKSGSGVNTLHWLCSAKKAVMLEDLRSVCKEESGVDMVLHPIAKGEDDTEAMKKILSAIKEEVGVQEPKIGVLAKEAVDGKVMEKWAEIISAMGSLKVDVSGGVGDLLTIKDDAEIQNIKKAAYLSASVMRVGVPYNHFVLLCGRWNGCLSRYIRPGRYIRYGDDENFLVCMYTELF